ncbi:MAG TPA: FAD-dependent oxidoreductase, partial [Kiloniellaceae bacterium]|nr:FAD-dependent oxidoreductase [Kiloniellaceae bacterium]
MAVEADEPAGMKETPLWWDDVPPPDIPRQEPPATADVAIVGSGYTGLNAALETARGGRSTVVFDAESAGWGCSSRNGGQVSTSIKPSLEALARRHGAERAQAIHDEGAASLAWIKDFIAREKIDCDFRQCGRFHAAHTPQAYDTLMRKGAPLTKGDDPIAVAVPRSEQRRELGSDHYYGGVVYPHHAVLHPAKYHKGLLDRARQAGAQVIPHCPVLAIERDGKG